MLQAISLISISVALILAPTVLIDLAQSTEKANNKEIYATITQMEDLKAYNNLYVDKNGISGTNNLLYHGVKPSELLVYDKDVTDYDGILLNHYDSALQSYVVGNPTGTPTCTDLADTKLITYNDCDYIVNKKMQMMTLDGSNKVVFETSESFGKKMTDIMNLSSNESIATTTTKTVSSEANATNGASTTTEKTTTYKIGREQSEIDKNGANNKKNQKVLANVQTKINTLIEDGNYLLAAKELERISRGNVDNDIFILTNALINKVAQQTVLSETKQLVVTTTSNYTEFVNYYLTENARLQSIGLNNVVDTNFNYKDFTGLIIQINTTGQATFSFDVFGKHFSSSSITSNVNNINSPSSVASYIVKVINYLGNGEIVASNSLNIVTIKHMTKATNSILVPKDCEILETFEDYTSGVTCTTSSDSYYTQKLRYSLSKVVLSTLVTNPKYQILLSQQAKEFLGLLTSTQKEDIISKIIDEKYGLANDTVKTSITTELKNIINTIQ